MTVAHDKIGSCDHRQELITHKVLGCFEQANYITERIWVPVADGAKVPVSLLYRNKQAPAWLFTSG